MCSKTFFLLIAVYLAAVSSVCAQVSLYVAPDGSGTAYTAGQPGNLANVNDRIRELKANRRGNITVYLKGGTYMLNKTILLSWETAAKDTTSVVVTSLPGERAVLSGGMEIKHWISDGNGIYKARVPEGVAFRQLYVNGKMAVRARYPNRDNENDFGPYFRVKNFDVERRKISVKSDEMPALASLDGVEMVMNQHWYQSRVRIAAVERAKDSLLIALREPEAQIFFGMTSYNMHLPGKPYYWENAREFLDSPGEWYLDVTTHWLYYKPLPGTLPAASVITVPVLETLLQVRGTGSHLLARLHCKNIDFRHSTWLQPDRRGSIATQGVQQRKLEDSSGTGMIQVEFADRFVLEQCLVTGAGAHGIVFAKGVQNSNIIHNHFDQLSANAIVIDTDKKQVQADSVHCTLNIIAYNLLENIGMHYTNGMGILASNISKHTIAHNEIRYGRYTGMQIGNHYGDNLSRLRDNRIEYNNIHHVMLLHDDGGAIYTLSNQPGTKILKNWIHDYSKCQWADSYPVNGVFLDNNSAYIQVEDNVFTNLKEVDRLKENIGTKVHDNQFRNNSAQDPDIIKAAGM
jgi:hypothetical protein